MIDKFVYLVSGGGAPLPGAVKGTAVATTSIGGALIASGVINASTGPIIAGMVTVVGTAVVVVAGQFWAASNKAFAERKAIEAKAESERRAAELAADSAERAALLRDSQLRESELREEVRGLREKLEAEIRRGYGSANSASSAGSSGPVPGVPADGVAIRPAATPGRSVG